MRISVVSAFNADSTFANVVNSSKMAQGFAENGHDVLLICRKGKHTQYTPKEHRQRYGLPNSVRIKMLEANLDPHVKFPRAALWHVLLHRSRFVYARNYTLPYMTGKLGIPTAIETHTGPDNTNKSFLKCLARMKKIQRLRTLVTIAPILKQNYVDLGTPKEKIIVLPDAVDTAMFTAPDTLPPSPFAPGVNIAHCGNLFYYKGVEEMFGAAKLRPDWTFHFVGGNKDNIATTATRKQELGAENIIIHGHVPHSAIPTYLWHADALITPLTTTHASSNWTSPMKLGEYMTARKPIVASDVPALRHWVGDEHVHFIQPDSAPALAQGIQDALDAPDKTERAQKAWQLAQGWSFKNRARTILEKSLG